MSTTTTTTPPKPEKASSPWARLAVGCFSGCGIVFLLSLIATGAGVFWAVSPGEQLETESIVADDSQATFRTVDLATDPGIKELLNHALAKMHDTSQANQRQNLPEELRWMSELQRTPSSGDYAMFIPRDVTVTLEENPEDPEDFAVVVAANFRSMVRPMRKMISMVHEGSPNGAAYEHRGVKVYPMDGTSALAFHGGTLLWASHGPVLAQVIDRIKDGTPAAGRSPKIKVPLPEGDWDVTGALGNPVAARRMLDNLASSVPASGAPAPPGEVATSFGIDIVSADEARIGSVLKSDNVGTAVAWAAHLQEAWRTRADEAARDGIKIDYDIRTQGSDVVTTARMTGLQARVDEVFGSLIQVSGGR